MWQNVNYKEKTSLWEAENPFAGRNFGIQNGLSTVQRWVTELLL